MIGLVISACLFFDPGRCKDFTMSFLEDQPATPFQCAFYGQIEIAKWQESNPNWVVNDWKCDDLSRPKYKI